MAWAKEREDYDEVCAIIDNIKSPGDFYKAMDELWEYDQDLVRSVRETKQCYNALQYEQKPNGGKEK